MDYKEDIGIETLLNKTIIEINNTGDEITFTTDDGNKYMMLHYQDCCEGVSVEDIVGNLEDLLNSPIIMAEEVVSSDNPDDIKKEYQDSFTWTFYKLATVKGYVTIRWYGESNGYYSESVSFVKI